jgi:ArsR family transcriptional regulator
MEASDIYKCIADTQRLRILSLLDAGPLCVCHIQEILGESQVKISKQLAYMKQRSLLEASRQGTWMVYALTKPLHGLIRANIEYLLNADCEECNQLQVDRIHRAELITRLQEGETEAPIQLCKATNCC